MTKIVLTDEQKDAIYTRNKNIIVSAAAGSGKTKEIGRASCRERV